MGFDFFVRKTHGELLGWALKAGFPRGQADRRLPQKYPDVQVKRERGTWEIDWRQETLTNVHSERIGGFRSSLLSYNEDFSRPALPVLGGSRQATVDEEESLIGPEIQAHIRE